MSKIKKYIEAKNVKSVILLSIILLILVIIIGFTKSDAVNLNNINLVNPITVTYNDLISSPYLYCIKHGGSIGNKGNTYYADYHVSIRGTTAISESKWGNGTNNNLYNAKLAYILASEDFGTRYGYGTSTSNHTPRQEKLWSYWNGWVENSGSQLGLMASQWKHGTSWQDITLPTSATNASICSNVGASIETNNQKAGPFNVTYTGEISSIIVRDVNGNEIQNDGCYFTDESGNTFNAIKNIPSGQNFYMVNYTGKSLKEITINVNGIGYTYNADIWLLHTSGKGQNLMVANASKDIAAPASVTIGISYNNTSNNTLRVVKYGVNSNGEEEKQAKVGFVVYRDGAGYLKRNNIEGYIGKEVQIGKMDYNETQFSWTTDKNDATIFETVNTDDGWTGYFQVTDIPAGTYYIGEVYNRNRGYEQSTIGKCNLEKYKGNDKISSILIGNARNSENISGYDNKLQVVNISLENDGYTKILRVYDTVKPDKTIDPEKFNIYINKVNTSNIKLGGAEFKIKVLNKEGDAIGWLDKISDAEYNYEADYRDATTWSSTYSKSTKDGYVYAKAKGNIEITNLSTEYQYQIYETKPGENCYALSSQIIRSNSGTVSSSGMNVKINNNKIEDIKYLVGANKSTANNGYAATDESIYCGTTSYEEENASSVNVEVTNRRKTSGQPGGPSSSTQYLYIAGKIWIDEKIGKQQVYNDLYDSSIESLYKQSVKISLINSSGTTVKTTTTTSGTYSLNTGISITSSTSNESIASNLSGYYLKFEYSDKYSTVSPKLEEQNGSKALIQEGKEGIAYIYNLSDYIEKFYTYPTLEHMNMGLVGIEKSDYRVDQNIAYVKVVMNGYTYKYEYGGTGDTTKTAAPTVNWKNGSAYTRDIYPSDIAYSDANSWDESSLKIYVVYRININNTNMTNYGKDKSKTNSPVSYVEVDLKATSLTNTYDKDRYELETGYDKSSNADFGNWKDEGDTGVAIYTGNKLNNGIVPNKPITIYAQFKVKKEALNRLLKGEEEPAEKIPVTAKTEAYHNYWKAYYEWYKSEGKWKSKLVCKDMKTDSYPKTASAYYLRLTINTERTITGTVFEDENVYKNGEVLGDGMYGNKTNSSEKENTISNVKVDLIVANEDGTIKTDENGKEVYASLYSKDKSYTETKAENMTTAPNGTYSFVGVTPGRYYVRFTYGDGNQKIIKPDGTEEGTVSIADYKSTVVAEECIQRALGYEYDDGVKGSEEWYKHKEHPNKEANKIQSTATDNLTQRTEYNKDKNSRNSIEANTPLMSVGVENTIGDFTTITKEDNGTKETILGINFGIIDIPEVSLAFDKVVSNIQITNAQGNILAEGNPASKNVKYVSDLDGASHIVDGSQYTKSEISEDELYGSTLKLQYSITVQNNSAVNYFEKGNKDSKYFGYYYMFGDYDTEDYSQEVTITVDNVLDFIDPVIKYENISIDGNHKITQVKALDSQDIVNNIQSKTELTYEYLVDITDWKTELYTTKNGEKNYSKDKTQDTAEMTVTRLLSAEDDDLGVSNVAQVTKIHVTDTPSLVETIDASETYFNNPTYTNPTEEVYVTVTPPTGKDTMTTIIYIIIEIIALTAISVGIVFIKKKVIDK